MEEAGKVNVASAELECWTPNGTALGFTNAEPLPTLDVKAFRIPKTIFGHDFLIVHLICAS